MISTAGSFLGAVPQVFFRQGNALLHHYPERARKPQRDTSFGIPPKRCRGLR